MVHKYLSFSIAITFISFMIGMAVNVLWKNTPFYINKLSSLNFIKSDMLNKYFGVDSVKWIIKNTPLSILIKSLN
jgi:hypothetical protein